MDIVITVSGFAATPSLASVVACHYAMRSHVKAYSLTGHGCAGGLVGIELAQALLEVHPQEHLPVSRYGPRCMHSRGWML